MRFLAVLFAVFLPLSAVAQERPNTILVLDGSGSMWGQIDGTAKITIAQDVVQGLLGSIPGDQQLGLTVYGHRTRGDCTDIETMVAPGANTREAISAAVGGIKPLGKTPMTDAVIAAANALRYTEDKATVILVSDGVETCNPDPCAAARLLEESGIDFTAHVVGFDVGSDPEALAQMQCIAGETGGQFLTAENADELATALVTVAAEPPAPAPVRVIFRGIAGPDGPVISDALVWSISGPGGQIASSQSAPTLAFDLLPGDYAVSALWSQYEEIVDLTARVSQAGIVDVVFPAPPPRPVEITFVAIEGRNGPRISDPLEWQFFQNNAQLGETLTGASITGSLPQGAYRVVVTRREDGATAEETFGVGRVDATVTLILPEFRPPATVQGPAEVVAGSTFDATWTGPDADLDYIATVRPGARPGESETYAYTREGPLVKIRAPATPGTYELQYVLRDGSKVLAAQPLTVTPVTAILEAPAEGVAGETITVTWEGPDYELDYIAVVAPGAARGATETYTYSRDGSPLGLKLPADPGTYEIQYVMRQDSTVLTRTPITVTAVGAEITAPQTATAGERVTVEWTGPDYELDYIAITKPDDRQGTSINYTYTREGSPLELVMPAEPGEYEIRYTLRQDGKTLATRPITVAAVGASLGAPEAAAAGAVVTVEWTGPDYDLDYISVSDPESRDGVYENYTYTREGTPLNVVMPTQPGIYELRYTMRQDGRVIARRPITVTEVTAELSAPDTATAGQAIVVEWTGPDYNLDFITVSEPGQRDGAYVNYTYTREGSPLEVVMPAEPGEYELRYTMRQDGEVIARKPITVAAVTATLEAPDAVPAGSAIPVAWTGPDYHQDFISIARPDDRDSAREAQTPTREGADLFVEAPMVPGSYELRYVLRQDTTVLVRRPIEVLPVAAVLTAPETAPAGGPLDVTWEGPGYSNDRIAVAVPGSRSGQMVNYTPTREGQTLSLTMPAEPGTYELQYIVRGKPVTVVARREITVTPVTASITAPVGAKAGDYIQLEWDGPGYRSDDIVIAEPGGRKVFRRVQPRGVSPVEIQMPADPGEYELRYVMSEDNTVLVTVPLTIAE